jgi:hypothetical protein
VTKLWSFLQQKRNREVLAWIGGGLVAAVAGLWTVLVYTFPPKHEDGGTSGAQANCGGIAIGGTSVVRPSRLRPSRIPTARPNKSNGMTLRTRTAAILAMAVAASIEVASAQTHPVAAATGAVAIGGDVSGSTIKVGLSPEQVQE